MVIVREKVAEIKSVALFGGAYLTNRRSLFNQRYLALFRIAYTIRTVCTHTSRYESREKFGRLPRLGKFLLGEKTKSHIFLSLLALLQGSNTFWRNAYSTVDGISIACAL